MMTLVKVQIAIELFILENKTRKIFSFIFISSYNQQQEIHKSVKMQQKESTIS